MLRVALVIALCLVACSPDDSAGSTTTSPATTSLAPTTTLATTTSTATTAPTTTTSTPSTTTTMSEPTTSVMPGNWADEPLVTTAFGALGWWNGDEWLDAESEGELPVLGGEDYQVIRVGLLAQTTAGPQTTVCEPLGNIGVEIVEPDLLGQFPGPYGVAVSASWELQPHLFEEAADDGGEYSGFARKFLASRGLDVADPVIKQIFRTDLEGDGINEVIFVAEEATDGFILQDGDYSVALMRKVVAGTVETAVLGDTVVLGDDQQFQGTHTIGAVADLNGDGKMEIVTNTAFFEGFEVSVWEYVDDDLGLVRSLQTGCGV